VEFRKAIFQIIPNCLGAFKSEANSSKIKKIGSEIRRDILDPEIAKLNRVYKKISRTRFIKIAGATIGTLSIELAAFMSGNILSSITKILGAGGLGILAKEYADYQSDLLSLKENPWYFAWCMKRKANK